MREHVFRPKRRVNGKLRVSREWKGRYMFAGDQKPTEVALHTTEKTIAAERLRAIVREKQNERCGIVAPKQLRDGAQRLLTDHLADFEGDLKALGRDEKYVYNVGRLVRRVLDDSSWLHPKDVTPDGFITWRAAAAKTLRR